MRRIYLAVVALFLINMFLLGCQSTQGNQGVMNNYVVNAIEAEWIRDGLPIEYDNEKWYPTDNAESLQDSEVYLLGEYKGVQFFVDKMDVKPYNRLYTKFSKNKFRFFEKKAND